MDGLIELISERGKGEIKKNNFEMSYSSVDQNTFFMYWLVFNSVLKHKKSNSFNFKLRGAYIQEGRG